MKLKMQVMMMRVSIDLEVKGDVYRRSVNMSRACKLEQEPI